MDDFMNKMGLGDPDPSNYKTGFDGADEIVDWFKQDKPTIGDNVTRYSIIHKDGSETPYVWCDKTKQMVVKKIVMQALVYGNGSHNLIVQLWFLVLWTRCKTVFAWR